jgi:exopolysaccharide biosynthesis protein
MKKFVCLIIFSIVFSVFAKINLVGKFNWQGDSVKTLENGIIYTQMEFKEPRIMKLAVIRIDLANSALRFKITPKSDRWGEAMEELPQYTIHTERQKTRTFMENSIKNRENMVIAINGSPWTPWQKPWNHRYGQVRGLLVADGVVVAPADKLAPSFVVRKDGSCDLLLLDSNADLSDIRQAISGFGFVLQQDHIPLEDSKDLAPRTGYGLSADRQYLYLLVIDGRQENYSMGSSVYEVGQLLQFFGASDGVNMDGGGSTTLLIRQNGEIKKLNHHKNDAERTVAASMGIIIDK